MSRRNRRKDVIVASLIIIAAYVYWRHRPEPAITFDQRTERREQVESAPSRPIGTLPGINRGTD